MSDATLSTHAASTRRRVPPGPNPFTELPRNPANDRLFFHKLLDQREQWGEVVRVGLPGMSRYIVNHPDDVQHVLHENHRNYGKECFEYSMLRLMVGRGLVTSDGELWRRQRRLAAPAFTPKRVDAFASAMTRAGDAMLAGWEQRARAGEPFELGAEMMDVTLRIVGDALFGFDTSGEGTQVGPAFGTAMEIMMGRSPLSLPLRIPTRKNRRFNRAMATLRALVERIIEERRREPGERGDLLSSLLAARDEETGLAMDSDLLRDEVLTLLLAGHETTAMALTWCLYRLSLHPEVQRSLLDEVDSVLGGRTPGASDLAAMPYTRQVIDESMRLHPPVWAIARVAREPDQIGGYPVRAGQVLLLSPYATHRHPDFWENPEGFDPERFAPEKVRRRHRFAYFPFAGGARICIGNNFALLEAGLLLAMVAQRYRLELVPGRPVEPRALVTLRPRDGIWMRARAREPLSRAGNQRRKSV